MKILGHELKITRVDTDMAEEDYHANRSLSKSTLSGIEENPLKFWYFNVNPDRPVVSSTKAQALGSAAHIAVLEPKSFDDRVVAMPELNLRTNEGKAKRDKFTEENQGKLILKKEEMDTVLGMQEAVQKCHKDLLSTINSTEVSVFAELDGYPVKSRFDATAPAGVIIDLKTTESASEWGFAQSVKKYRYDVQAGFYSAMNWAITGKKPHAFYFLCVEKKPPYCTAVYKLDDDYVRHGVETFMRWFDVYRQCLENNHWPDYNNGGRGVIAMPEWMKKGKNNEA